MLFTRKTTAAAPFLPVICFFSLWLQVGHLQADPPANAVLVDGLTVLIGGRAGNQSDAMPILHSDVKRQALLMQLVGGGPKSGLYNKARRVVVVVTVLAAQAKQLKEQSTLADINGLKKLFSLRAGSLSELNQKMARVGTTEPELDRWFESLVLAASQIRYVESQVELPTSDEVQRRAIQTGGEGTPESASDLYDRTRRQIIDERTVQTVMTWLFAVLESANVRILK